jgi:hypothetical protein
MFNFLKSNVLEFARTCVETDHCVKKLLNLLGLIMADQLTPLHYTLNVTESGKISIENTSFTMNNYGTDVPAPPRENLVNECTDFFFQLCSESCLGKSQSQLEAEQNIKIYKLAQPILLSRCKTVIEKYIDHRRHFAGLPMPRY